MAVEELWARYRRRCTVIEGPADALHDRRSEREALECSLNGVRGQSRVLVVTGWGKLTIDPDDYEVGPSGTTRSLTRATSRPPSVLAVDTNRREPA